MTKEEIENAIVLDTRDYLDMWSKSRAEGVTVIQHFSQFQAFCFNGKWYRTERSRYPHEHFFDQPTSLFETVLLNVGGAILLPFLILGILIKDGMRLVLGRLKRIIRRNTQGK